MFSSLKATSQNVSKQSIQRLLTAADIKQSIVSPASTIYDINKASQTVARAFNDLPVSLYLKTSTHKGLPQHEVEAHFFKTLTKYVSKGGIIIQSHDHAAVALWLPPNFAKAQPSTDQEEELEEIPPQFQELGACFASASKRNGFDERPHWHLQFLAKDPLRSNDLTTKGAISSIVKPILQRAVEVDKVPVVLESAGEKATLVYKHWGFKTLEKLSIDEGRVTFDYMVYND
ncbi:CYFA0S02e08350g1_1 [Cyberlindnera fabianii]|uniref:CYFA0S02e08350g1_1 n=1 Tax=Cyberlindnera fabianii TaxID=36022 RepID=A0A061AW22_CYBFA|nr:CYFA0S02e08350g1_1 [Cyberlindnera fabianii]